MFKKILSLLISVVLVFLLSFSAFGFQNSVRHHYDYDVSHGGFSLFFDETFKSLSDLPYGKNSKIIEIRSSRSASSSSVSHFFCFTNTQSLWVKINQNYRYGQSNPLLDSFDNPYTLSDEWSNYTATGYCHSDGGTFVDIYSTSPILEFVSKGGSKTDFSWKQVGIPQNIRLSKDTETTTKNDDVVFPLYTYSNFFSDCSYSVMNFCPFNFVDATFEVQYTSSLNCYAFVPVETDTVYELEAIYDVIAHCDSLCNSIYNLLTTAFVDLKNKIDSVKSEISLTNSELNDLYDWLAVNLYSFLDQWYGDFLNYAYVWTELLDNINSTLNQLVEATPNNGFNPDLSQNNQFGDDYFGGNIDTENPDLSSFTDGIGGFTRIYNMLDTAFGGFLSEALVVLLLLAFISYVMGRKVNKG